MNVLLKTFTDKSFEIFLRIRDFEWKIRETIKDTQLMAIKTHDEALKVRLNTMSHKGSISIVRD